MEPKTAVGLITERTENGPFSDLDDAAKRVKGLGPALVQTWKKDAYCGEPDGARTATATDIGIYRELKEIRQLLEQQSEKKGDRKSAARSGRERRGPDRDARDLVLRFTDARGSNDDIRKWYAQNKDRLTFDPEKGRFVVTGESPAGDAAGEAAPSAEGDSRPAGRFSVNTLKKGDTVPGFTVKSLDGQTISLEDYRGKIVLIDFWATWCSPCLKEAPTLREAYQTYHDRGFEVIGISLDGNREKLEKFIEENKIVWPQIFDGLRWKSALAQIYGVTSIPRQILLDRDLRVISPNARGENLDEALTRIFHEN